jgi:hypothetical protein
MIKKKSSIIGTITWHTVSKIWTYAGNMCMGMVSRRTSCPTEARDTKTRGATPAELQAGQANTVPFLSAPFYDDATVPSFCPLYYFLTMHDAPVLRQNHF